MFLGHLFNFILFWRIYIKILSKSCPVMKLAECPGVDQSAALRFQSLKSGSWPTFSPSPAAGSEHPESTQHLSVELHYSL